MKKILYIILTSLLCTIPNIKIDATDNNSTMSDIIANAQASNEIEEFLNQLGIDFDVLYDFNEKAYFSPAENYYGGAWIDEDNVPHVAFAKKFPNIISLVRTEFENVVIETVSSSLMDLLRLQASISQLNIETINYIALDEPNNCLLIGLSSNKDMGEVIESINIINTEKVKIVFEFSDPYERYAASVYGGSVIHGDSVSATCSVGFKVKKGSKSGFVTAAHCYDLNESVYFASSGQVIGKVNTKESSTTMDAAFVETNNNANVLQKGYGSTLANNYDYTNISSSGITSGSKVISFGNNDSEVCKITSTNFTVSYSDGKLLNLLQTDCSTGYAWSGGLTLKADIDLQGTVTYKAIGIVNGGSGSNTVYVKANNILSSLGLSY